MLDSHRGVHPSSRARADGECDEINLTDRLHTSTRKHAIAALLSALAFGCGQDLVPDASGGGGDRDASNPTGPDASTIPATIELGLGFDTWHPIDEGQDVRVHIGLQGGRHIEGNALAGNVWPGESRDDSPAVRYLVTAMDGTVLTEDVPPIRQPMTLFDDGEHYCYPRGVYLYLNRDVFEYDDQLATLSMSIEDKDGKTASDSRTIVLRVDEL